MQSSVGMNSFGRAIAIGTIGTMVTLMGGCSGHGTKTSANAPGNSGGATYIDSYRNGDYAEAYRTAAKSAMTGTNADGEQAALIAGQAAHAQGNFSDAQRWLRILLDSDNKQIAGQAGATLGLIAQQTGDQQQAADLLLAAGNKLTLDAAARSQLYAGDSLSRLGKGDEARAAWEKAQHNAKYDAAIAATIESRLATGTAPAMPKQHGSSALLGNDVIQAGTIVGSTPKGAGSFTLQAGVFSTLSRAVNAASQITPQAKRAGYEAPRVVNTFDTKGKRVYAVRFGHFANKDVADSARAKFGSGVIATKATGE